MIDQLRDAGAPREGLPPSARDEQSRLLPVQESAPVPDGDAPGVSDRVDPGVWEGKMHCYAVLDTFSSRIVGWSIDNHQDSSLVVNALDMAIKNRKPAPGGIVHADHGVQFTSWAFTRRIRAAGLMASFGTIGDGYDNAMMESIWSSMQIVLLNWERWRTRIDLANVIFECIEIFYSRQRRHLQLDYESPVTQELRYEAPSVPAGF